MMVFSSRKLKVLRVSKGLSQTDLANLVGCSQNTISAFETGLYQPSLKNALSISLILGCKIEDLVEVLPDEGD